MTPVTTGIRRDPGEAAEDLGGISDMAILF
jgi:hypothetical protein